VAQTIANWASFLQSEATRGGNLPASGDAAGRILAALAKMSEIPLRDLVRVTGLSPEDCLKTVEALRAGGQVEVLERTDSELRLLRLTPAGYARALKSV